jgi:hypothetical protein
MSCLGVSLAENGSKSGAHELQHDDCSACCEETQSGSAFVKDVISIMYQNPVLDKG